MTYRLSSLVVLSCLLSACASSGPPRGGSGGGGADRTGGLAGANVAMPMALALTGLASSDSGVIDLATVQAQAAAEFDQFDADGSGHLTPIEHARWAKAILGDAYARPTMRMIDLNRDNKLSEDEFSTAYVESAQRYDKDKDGQITRSELLRAIPEGRFGSGRAGGESSRALGDEPRGQGGRPPR